MTGTAVPAPALGPAGFTAPAESAVLTGTLADINAAFGGSLNTALSTPQGQLASSLAAIIGDANDQFLALANGVDPAYASGRLQDAIGRIYYITRKPALPTTAACVCAGLPGVVIPAGALATAVDGSRYACTGGGTIGPSGAVVLSFANLATGPVACPAGTLNAIYQAIPGWDSITNPSDGLPGVVVESRADFEFRRAQSVAANARNTLSAIEGALLSVNGVTDAYVTDNASPVAVMVGGANVPANSIYAVAAGGTDAAVAAAIWLKKPPGIPTVGTTTVAVQDTQSGYSAPYPSYQINFTRPAPTVIYVAVALANGPAVPTSVLGLVQAAVIAAFTGADGGPRARIGSKLYASRFFAGIAALGPWAQVVSVEIGTAPNPTTTTTAFTISQLPILAQASVTVALV